MFDDSDEDDYGAPKKGTAPAQKKPNLIASSDEENDDFVPVKKGSAP